LAHDVREADLSASGPFGGSNPFEGLFGELAKLFSNQGSVNLQVARQMAQWLATEGQVEPNVEPLERMRYEELFRVADLNVSDATGLSTSHTGSVLSVRPVGRVEWAARTLDAYGPLLEGRATAMGLGEARAQPGHPSLGLDQPEDEDPAQQMLGGITEVMGPLLLGLQAGSVVGQLARRAFGQYDLPVPRPPSDEMLVVARTISEFAEEWDLPIDDVRLWVCLSEISHHAVLGQEGVHRRMDSLLRRYAGGFKLDLEVLEEKLGDIDPRDPSSFQSVLGDPAQLLGAMQTPEQRQVLVQIEAMVAVIEGYVDHVMDTVGKRLAASWPVLSEALRRRRVERGDEARLVETLLGIELSRAQYERGAAFVRGVLERAGTEGLARLWRSERELPTPAEVDAPGLWLERIDLPE
jgi:putative hydrolase